MTSTVRSLLPGHAIVEGTHSGVVSSSDLRAAGKQMLALCQENGTWHVLTDCTDVTEVPGANEFINLIEALEKAHVGATFRQALIWPVDAHARLGFDEWRTIEQNHGFHVRVFGGRDAAIAWLES